MVKIFSRDKVASDIFAGLAEQVLGTSLGRAAHPDVGGDLVLLGSMGSNPGVGSWYLEGKLRLPEIRIGSDDYYIVSAEVDGRRLLVLGGSRRRALLYAIYDYFERIGCRYFFDGDVLPHLAELPLTGFSVVESPRFDYRGIRYFAHRSLHRFQAEHWTLADWKREIDWIVKKRLNMFMLRIGMDDVFQKAFPDIVPYPNDHETCPPEFNRSYNDRRPFWSLEERGRLRKALLDYAFERDLMHPEDLGTMTHWYSPTPQAYVDSVQPEPIPSLHGHSGKTLEVWNIAKDRYVQDYFALTQAHIEHYGRPELFHTIGLAERAISDDAQVNRRWKIYAYDRIIETLRQHYPQAPLLLASWDFLSWKPEEVGQLLKHMDPTNTIFFDYTSDSNRELGYFMNWGVYQKFPWIFGIFQAFESGSDLRGNYESIQRRLAFAAGDPYCKGMVIWPENAHSDVLMYEYFAANAWNPEHRDIRAFIPVFCQQRYGVRAESMTRLWLAFLPTLQSGYWNHDQQYYGEAFAHIRFAGIGCYNDAPVAFDQVGKLEAVLARLKPALESLPDALDDLEQVELTDPMTQRDVIDLARTAAARLFQYGYDYAQIQHLKGGMDLSQVLAVLREVLGVLKSVLAASPDFSLNATMDGLRAAAPVRPEFEQTLKGNAENEYCRSFVSELFACYEPEFELFATEMLTGERHEEAYDAIQDAFYATPLKQYRPDHAAAQRELPNELRRLTILAKRMDGVCGLTAMGPNS